VSAPEIAHHVVRMHKGSELAIKDRNVGWQKIHRISSVTRLSVREFSYTTDCRLHIESSEDVWPLSSGRLLGNKCVCCWPAPVAVVAA
jgi:hypothetical protein